MQVLLQPAYVLHLRPYRNTSAILDVLTHDYGRIGVIAKGVKRPDAMKQRALLQPFTYLSLSYSGRRELYTLIGVEAASESGRLGGDALFSALYLNELLVKLLHRGDAHPQLFTAYHTAVQQLKEQPEYEPALRRFEIHLLREIGYALSLEADALTREPIQPGVKYYYDPVQGPLSTPSDRRLQLPLISGECLRALAHEDFSDRALWPEMKLLMRAIIGHHLDGYVLRSRDLFVS